MTSRRVTPTRVGLMLLGVVALLLTGAAGGVAWTTDAVPADLRPAMTPTTFPVGSTDFDDARTVRLTVTRGSSTQLTSPVEGRVTRSDCIPGAPIESGTSPVSVNDVPVVALATATPLWRDLVTGDTGPDVTALQQELVRLGYPAGDSRQIDRATLGAFTRLRDHVGAGSTAQTQVTVADVLWLPAASTRVGACTATTGSTITVGDDLAEVPGALTNVSVLDLPSDLVEGPRVLRVDGTRVPFVPGAVPDAATLAALEGLPSLQSGGEEDEPPTATLALTDPVQVSVVPPASVLGDDESSCVLSSGQARAVRVAGSELGQTFVVFEGTAPEAVDLNLPRDAECG